MNSKQIEELVLQSLEHEIGGAKIYAAAIGCAANPDLKKEWQKYLKETKTHIVALTEVCAAMRLDPEKETPGRAIVRHNGAALVEAIGMAADGGDAAAAQIVACECVVLAETKDHANWQLLGKVAEYLEGPAGDAIQAAYEAIEDQEDAHLYHTKGWCRELWLESFGLDAVLPPPEETLHVKTAIGAARAEASAELRR